MKILEMIMEWRKGCSCATPEHPEKCPECTLGLIEAIERREKASQYSGCIAPRMHEMVASLYGAVTRVPPKENNWLGSQVLVERAHLEYLMLEFFKLDMALREKTAHVCPNNHEEDHRVA